MNFLCSYFNTEDGRKSSFFSISCFILIRKVKTKLKCKRFVQYTEKAVYRETDQICFCAGDFSSDGHQQFGQQMNQDIN